MREPTQEEVLAFYDAITQRFNLRIVSKDDSAEMKLIAELLQKMGIQDVQTFLKRYWTTLPFDAERLGGPSMYVPFSLKKGEIWAREECWPRSLVPWHEAPGHVRRFRIRGAVTFALNYVVSTEERTREETYALGLTKSGHYWRVGELFESFPLASNLREYGCSGNNVALATVGLDSVDPTLEAGGAINDDDQWCRDWWTANAPDIRADHLRG